VQVLVRENNVDQALRVLKKKMQREGIFREMKLRRNYEKPSERRARERAEAIRRTRKLMRKRMEREGYYAPPPASETTTPGLRGFLFGQKAACLYPNECVGRRPSTCCSRAVTSPRKRRTSTAPCAWLVTSHRRTQASAASASSTADTV
jgi:small subunit ribosomal protein S21